MNEYEVFLNMRTNRIESERRLRNAQFAAELRENEKAQPHRLRFHVHLRLPRFLGFRLFRRQQRHTCTTTTPVNAH